MIRIAMLCSATALAAAAFTFAAAPAEALTMKECGAKYQAAKKGGKDVKWQEFRKAECGDEDVSEADAAKEVKDEAPKTAAAPAAAAGKVSYPKEVAAKYAGETPGKARLHTCLDQYNADKQANGGVAPMRWIQKGGGYYSQCNAKLKG